jgi:hypothetical protein
MKPQTPKITDAANDSPANKPSGYSLALLIVACQLFAILLLVMHSSGAAMLTPEQISLMPLWGP